MGFDINCYSQDQISIAYSEFYLNYKYVCADVFKSYLDLADLN